VAALVTNTNLQGENVSIDSDGTNQQGEDMNETIENGNVLPFPGVAARDPVDLTPGTAYEVVTRAKVEELATDVKEIRDRIDGIFWLIAASIVVQIALRAMGIGH
jgi:hypothetical protein